MFEAGGAAVPGGSPGLEEDSGSEAGSTEAPRVGQVGAWYLY